MVYFPKIEKIKYEGTNTKNMYAFRHYNPEEIIMGKTMKEHLRFGCSILAHYDTRRFRSFWKSS